MKGKLLCGVLATALLAGGSHMLRSGDRFIDSLTTTTGQALAAQGLKSVRVDFERAPLRRIALLSGRHSDPAMRERALATARAVPGVMDAHWVEEEKTGPVQSGGSAGNNGGGAPTATSPGGAGASATRPGDGTDAGKTAMHKAPATTATATALTTLASSCQSRVDAAVGTRTINFRSGSPWVNFEARKVIGDVARAMTSCAGAKMTVNGYADRTGAAAINLSLSQARAEAVKAILVEKGLAAGRVVAVGHGSDISQGVSANARRIGFMVNGG